MNSKQVGNITEVSCMLEFMKLGITVCTPFGDCNRYDFVAEINGKFYRIQTKTANLNYLNDGYILFRCDNTTTKNGTIVHNRYTEEQIDFFCTFYDGKCYLVPVEECSREKRLRFKPPANGQVKKSSFAKDYELDKVVKNLC